MTETTRNVWNPNGGRKKIMRAWEKKESEIGNERTVVKWTQRETVTVT